MAMSIGEMLPRAPRTLYTLIEGRALLEMALLPALYPLLRNTPQGDGHPVLLVPGFTAGDATLVALGIFLRSRGYHVETWGLGQNTGFKLKFSQALEQKVRFMHHRHKRKVSLVGWSLGGVYAFYTAHAAADCVRCVISLGSPIQFSLKKSPEVPLLVKAIYRYLAHPMGPVAHLANVRAKVLRAPPPVPSTCIYSLTDGVVPPESAQLVTDDAQHENIWVPGSHIGLGFNAAVMWILADRLAQDEGSWAPFVPDGFAGAIYERCASLIGPPSAA
jgi:pimeloyl-ACP methyl ester carboxylesterase